MTRSLNDGKSPDGLPFASNPPSSSTKTNLSNSAFGTHTNLNAIRLLNWICATSRGGSTLQPIAHVDHDPPGPNSGMDATRIPSPRKFPTAIPFTFSTGNKENMLKKYHTCSTCTRSFYARIGTDPYCNKYSPLHH